MANEAELRFQATLEDNTSAKLDNIEKKLRAMGASPAEIKMILHAVDQASPKIADVQKQMDKMPKEHVINIKSTVDDAAAKISSLQKVAQEKPIQLKFLDNLDEVGSKLFNLRTKMSLPLGGALGGMGMGQLYGVGLAGAGVGAAGTAAIGLIQQGVQYNSQMEQSMVTLTQTLRDQSQARQEMGQLVQFAQKTPFAYGDVLAADVRLRSYQIPTMQGEGGPGNKGWLRSAGDMAAAMSTPITQAVEAIADARQGYFVRMMSYGIRMMREDFQAGGKYAGLSYEQGLERAIRRFEGSMQMQSKTFQGTISNLKDIFQQQVLGPVGLVPFQALKGAAQGAYNAMSDPKELQKIGAVMQDIQDKQMRFFATLKQGRILFEAHMKQPLESILSDVIRLGDVFGAAFGGTTAGVLKTVGVALFQVAGLVTNIASKMPGFVQFYGTMKALSMLGFGNISDPFLNLVKSVNPLTFSIRGIISSLLQLPGAVTKLGIALIAKHFIDANEASKTFERQFKNMSELSMDKLNMQVDGLALRLGKAAYEMKNLSVFASQTMEDAGLQGTGTGMKGAQLALNAAKQATLLGQNFGFDPQMAITMMADTFKERGTQVTTGAEDRFFNVLKQATVGIQALGGSAEDVVDIFNTFRDSAAKLGMKGPGFTDELFALRQSLTDRMTNAQVLQFKNPNAMIQEMLSGTAAPSVDVISEITNRGKNMGALQKYFSSRNFAQLPAKTNTIEDDHFAAVRSYLSGDMSRSRYMKFISGGMTNPPDFLEHPRKGPDKVSKLTDLQYSMDLITSTYLANERAKKQSTQAISKIAPTVDLSKIQPMNPFLDRGMQVNIQPVREAGTAEQQVKMIGKAWLEASNHLDTLNATLEHWQENITKTTGQQINYQNALDLVNSQMAKFQFDMTRANRAVEDASLALQKYQLQHVTPLQLEMDALNNSLSKVSNNLQIAQHEMSKYSDGLISGEQAALNQLHALDRYNKQLQLLQLNYQQMGADLGRTTYERGFSSRVEPIAGLSLQLQMERLQREQQRKQLEYDLSYGEQHYRLKQAGRSKYERMEMPFEERLKGVRENTEATDRYNEAQYRMQRQQFQLSQAMYLVNREVQAQQRHLTELQINVQEMQQSPAFRRLQDEQMLLQMHLDATNRKLNLQNQNLTQWQNLMDDLKNQKEGLGDAFAALTGAAGISDTEKVKSMVDLWSQLPKSMGGITDAQKKEIMRALEQSESAQKSQRDKSLAEYESWWDKIKNITSQGFIGLFTGQTWGIIGQTVKTAVAGLFSQLGLPGGDLLGGGLGTAITLGGTGYAMLTGLRLSTRAIKSGVLTGTAALAGKYLPETHAANKLAGGMAFAGEKLGRFGGIGTWLSEHGASSLLTGPEGDIAKWLKSLRPSLMSAFKLIQSLRITVAGALGGAAGNLVGGPLGGIAGAWFGGNLGENVPFRRWPIVGRPLSSLFPERVRDAAGGLRAPVKAAVDVVPDVKFIGGAKAFMGGVTGFIAKIFEFSGLGSLVKGLGTVGRVAGKAATISIPIFAALDVKTLLSGGDKRTAGFSLGATGAGAAIGGTLGLLGGPFAPVTVTGGALAGAAAGQLVGPSLSKINWSQVLRSIKDFFTKTLPDAMLDAVKALPGIVLDAVKLHIRAMAFALGAYFALTVKLPFQLARKGVEEGWSLAKKAFHGAINWLEGAISGLFTGSIKGAKGGAKWALTQLPGIIFNFIKNIPHLMWEAFKWVNVQLPQIIFRFMKTVPGMFGDALHWMVSQLPDKIWAAIGAIGDMFTNAIGSLPSDVWDAFKSGLDIVPGFQTGIERVDGNMIAKLHPGEAVLNSAQANIWRQQRLSGNAAAGGQASYQVGLSQNSSVDGTFMTIEDKWNTHLVKVQGMVRDHEKSVTDINEVANRKLVSTNKEGQKHIAKTIGAHNKAIEKHTRIHFKHVDNDTEEGMKKTNHTVKDWSHRIAKTWNTGIEDFKIPGMSTGKGGPLSALTGAFKTGADIKEHNEDVAKAIAGMTNKQLRKLTTKYYELPKRLRTGEAQDLIEKISDEFTKRTRAGHTSMSNNAQRAGARLGLMDDEDSDNKENRVEKVRRFWIDQEGKLHEQLRHVRKTANDQEDKDIDNHNKRKNTVLSGAWNGLIGMFAGKLQNSNQTYATGWGKIMDTTGDFIDAMSKAIGGIDEELGLTKGGHNKHKGRKGGPTIDGSAAYGGIIKGVGEPKGKLIRVGEEEDEVIIPLAPHRRERAISLVQQTMGRLGGHGSFANGGIQERMPGIDTAYLTARSAYAAAKGFANGGYVSGSPPTGAGSEGIRALAAQMFAKGFNVTSGGEYRGTGTYHDQQKALDFGDSVNNLKRLWSFLYPVKGQTLELFGPSYLGSQTLFKYGKAFSDAALQADHEDHIHVAVDHIIRALGSVRGMGPMGAAGLLAALGGKPLPKVPAKLKGMGAVGQVVYRALKRKLKKWGAAGGAPGISDVPTGGPRMWLTKALKITGHFSPENLSALYGRMMQESGGDPKAINLWDSNAAAGTPSKGLLQTIDPTFNAYKMRGYGNIWNPIDNAIAAIRYMYANYGHIVGPSSTGYAGGLSRVPYDNFPALLHKDEKVVPAGEANYERSGRKGRDVVSIGARWDRTLEQITNILEQIRKAKDYLKDIKDSDAKREARERLQALRNELASRRRQAAGLGRGFGFGIKRLLHKAGDRSGGERTAKLVAREQRKFQAAMRKAVARAKRSKGYRAASKQIRRSKSAIRKMRKGGVSAAERKRIRRQKERIADSRDRQASIIARARRKARTGYLKGAAKRGINAALIKAITGKALSKKEQKWYVKLAKDIDKDAKGRAKARKADRDKADKTRKAAQEKTSKAKKQAQKAAQAEKAKDKAMRVKELMKKDAARAKDKAEAAKNRAQREAKKQRRETHVDQRANKNDSRNDNYQKRTLDLLKDIARKDLNVNVHNEAYGATINSTVNKGSGSFRSK